MECMVTIVLFAAFDVNSLNQLAAINSRHKDITSLTWHLSISIAKIAIDLFS